MRSRIFLLSAFFFALTMFHPVQAKADSIWDILGDIFGNGNNNNNHHGHGNQGTNLPINSDVVYLMIAGIAIGVVAVKKSKSTGVEIKA